MRAAHLYVLAREVRENQPAYAELLVERAGDLQTRATALEEAAMPPPADAAQTAAQLQEQILPQKDGE